MTEYFRRTLIEAAGPNVGGLEVPIILTASAAAAFVGSYVICPFEAVRIRSVAQRDFAPNIIGVLNRMVDEEGVPSLFKAVPAFLAKEIPFAMAKFTVFDISTTLMYDYFPAAKESFQLSLVVSLVGGVLGGIVAAIVSNPADATISFMKKAKSDIEPLDAAKTLLQTGGIGALFRGLPLRLVFYMLLVSGQFFVYDAVRIALGVGADDLKLYLDVLGDVSCCHLVCVLLFVDRLIAGLCEHLTDEEANGQGTNSSNSFLSFERIQLLGTRRKWRSPLRRASPNRCSLRFPFAGYPAQTHSYKR